MHGGVVVSRVATSKKYRHKKDRKMALSCPAPPDQLCPYHIRLIRVCFFQTIAGSMFSNLETKEVENGSESNWIL